MNVLLDEAVPHGRDGRGAARRGALSCPGGGSSSARMSVSRSRIVSPRTRTVPPWAGERLPKRRRSRLFKVS